MTVEELKEEFELVAVDLLEKFPNTKLIIQSGIIPMVPIERGFHSTDNYQYSDYFDIDGFKFNGVRRYYRGFKVTIQTIQTVRKQRPISIEGLEEISKKLCIQTGYKLYGFGYISDYWFHKMSITINDPILKYKLVDPLHPALQSFRNK
jgi:hypothetical protein